MQLLNFYAARERIGRLLRNTPLEISPFLSKLCEGEIWIKLENQQINGSFKARGALNKIFQLSDEERNRGIVTASSGNHAQGVGYAAHMLGICSTIVVPTHTPMVKIEAIMRFGVGLEIKGDEYMDAEKIARDLERKEGMTFVSPYNDLDIIAGQGTIGLEMMETMPDLEVILVPVGGGGLIAGVGCAIKNIDDSVEIIGVQSVASPVMAESIKDGRIVEMELEDSVAEALHGGIEEGSVTFEMCQKNVDDFILVQEETIVKAISTMLVQQRQVVEGAGAVGVAALIENPKRFANRKVGVVVSGGNIDRELLRRICHDI